MSERTSTSYAEDPVTILPRHRAVRRGTAVSALDAAVRLAEAVADIKRTTHVISTTVCPTEIGDPSGPSHLRLYFEHTKHQPRDPWTGYPTDAAQLEAERLWRAVQACPSCRGVYDAVQARKAARRRRGIARAALARIGAAEARRRASEATS